MNEKEIIRSALLGDKQAQEKCTAKGIALPCPCCGRVEQAIINGSAVYHVHADCLMDARLVPLHKWNNRPAPPIGRCGECKHFTPFFSELGHCKILSQEKDLGGEGYCVEMLKTDFCNYFEPREE